MPRGAGGATAARPLTGAEARFPAERVQQRTASIDLSAAPSEVQAVADRVAHLAASLGGFVQSSQVKAQAQVQEAGTSRAELDLRLPSAKLGGALATLGQLAPVRSESQSLQDITDTYDAASRRLGDAIAERHALLRALAVATTESQIDSLRARLSQARRAIVAGPVRVSGGLAAREHVRSGGEVSATGTPRAKGSHSIEDFTMPRKVLVATLIVLLIASAVLVPLTLVVLALATGRRRWRRSQRERVLDAR